MPELVVHKSTEATESDFTRAKLAPGVPTDTRSLLSVNNLHTYFGNRTGDVRAVNGVSFDLKRNEILGLVGETGSGKSVTATSILRLVPPPGQIVAGEVRLNGLDLLGLPEQEMNRVRGKQIGLIAQNVPASFNPLISVGRQMENVFRLHLALSRTAAESRAITMLEVVGLPEPRRVARCYIHELSGGMAQRVMIALVMGVGPNLVIADEPTTGLDATVQIEVLDLMTDMIRASNASAILITHDLRLVAHYCDVVAVMYSGAIVEKATVRDLFKQPCHPYTVGLLEALAAKQVAAGRWAPSGPLPDQANPPAGCTYHPRCPLAVEICRAIPPDLMTTKVDGHLARCHRVDDVLKIQNAPTA